METMTNELTVIPRTIGMMTRMMDVILRTKIQKNQEKQTNQLP